MKEMMTVFIIIYSGFVIGTILKMNIYHVPVRQMPAAIMLPFHIVVLLPIYIVKNESKGNSRWHKKVYQWFVIQQIIIENFPTLIGIVAHSISKRSRKKASVVFSPIQTKRYGRPLYNECVNQDSVLGLGSKFISSFRC